MRKAKKPRLIIPKRTPIIQGDIALIPLADGHRFATIDSADVDLVSPYNWVASKGKGTHYAVRTNDNARMHRLILGLLDAGRAVHVDHIDYDGLNNRRSNIRIATASQNVHHRRQPPSNRRFRGVYKDGDSWYASLMVMKKSYGRRTNSEIEAARAYDEMAIQHFGEYAVTNFPKEEYRNG